MNKIYNKSLKEGSKNWLNRHINDKFVQQRETQGYRSRSAFKLLEMQKKYKIFNNDSYILDLGCAPGGWSQILSKKITKGKILALDILNMKKIENVEFIMGDFSEEKNQKKIFEVFNRKIDAVISDMAYNTTGNKHLDSYKTGELCLSAMDFSKKILNKNGVFLSKLFMGSSFKPIEKKAKEYFKKVSFFKPNSSRKDSKELYIFCKNVIT